MGMFSQKASHFHEYTFRIPAYTYVQTYLHNNHNNHIPILYAHYNILLLFNVSMRFKTIYLLVISTGANNICRSKFDDLFSQKKLKIK